MEQTYIFGMKSDEWGLYEWLKLADYVSDRQISRACSAVVSSGVYISAAMSGLANISRSKYSALSEAVSPCSSFACLRPFVWQHANDASVAISRDHDQE